MPGVGHVRHLADIEALQHAKNVLGPASETFGRRIRSGVHFHFQWFNEAVFRCGTLDGMAIYGRAKTAYRPLGKSMTAWTARREIWLIISTSKN
jgi:hypothetical protein